MGTSPREDESSAGGARSRRPVGLGLVLLVLLASIGIGVGAVALFMGGGADADTEPAVPSFGQVRVDGEPLPPFEAGSPDPAGSRDPAVGQDAPRVAGSDPSGRSVEVGGTGRATAVVFLAHWCEECRAQVASMLDHFRAEGGVPGGARVVAVLTRTDSERANFPPVEWLGQEGWPLPILLDDRASSAAQAYGATGELPHFVFIDGNGRVASRASGTLETLELVTHLERIGG